MSRKASPDFFIIGAPKCGTSALATYLSAHPGVQFSKSKEPNFFSRDLDFFRFSGTHEEYMDEYFPGQHDTLLLGEGTPFYLYSEVAVPAILAQNPAAKFIVMLRNPVEQVVSMHAQRLLNSHEDREDFGTAWQLQDERRAGRQLPTGCRDPKILLYREIADYPRQLTRLFQHAQRSQVKVILFDDFSADTGEVYRDVLQFLGLPAEDRRQFEVVGQRQTIRNVLLARFLSNPPPVLLELAGRLKRALGLEQLGVIGKLRAMNTDPAPESTQLDSELIAELESVFREDTLALQEMLGVDLSDWL
jgi:hypothetical protein